jgi:hypothetical protein
MTEIVPVENLSPAQKAWRTRIANGYVSRGRTVTATPPRPDTAAAIAAFDRQADAESPDWHAAALELRRALQAATARPAPSARREIESRPSAPPRAIPAPVLDDHPLRGKLVWCPPTIVCGFADGEIIRMSFASIYGKPLRIAGALRIAITAYRYRMASKTFGKSTSIAKHARHAHLIDVPAIAYCVVRRDDVQVATYDAAFVTRETHQLRQPLRLLAAE